jgi:hypothetical protein
MRNFAMQIMAEVKQKALWRARLAVTSRGDDFRVRFRSGTGVSRLSARLPGVSTHVGLGLQ